jgi:hypothetical protein
MCLKIKNKLKARCRERDATINHPNINYNSGFDTKSVNKVKRTVEN